MIKPTIADAGIIAGYLNKKDQWHQWTLEQLKNLPIPFLTCEAIITEACFLMQSKSGGKDDVLKMLVDGVLQIDFSLADEVSEVKTLMRKYEDIPMSLADACLVRMSELIDNSVVFTLDSDFHIYRKNGRKKIDLIIPE
jgi:predicted nucleic acid-binding protein